jgi:hypothetical protein
MQARSHLAACVLQVQVAPFTRMRYNSAAHADARASAVLCKAHRTRAGGCER